MSEANDLETRAGARVGTVLRGKYRLDRVLGIGGMAVVYVATHRNQKQFAVKMLHPELSLRQDIRDRFLREGYAANSVKHPGAVAVLDEDTAEDGAAFLVMELLEGAPVEELWERRGQRLPAGYVLGIAHQLLDVLAAAHGKGIIHRDIKPANLFLTFEGQVKVLDFGIARVRDLMANSGQVTGTGMLLGTPAFMPPEQALAKTSEIDALTDVWAVGATMFTLFTGRSVHEGDTAPQLIVKVATTRAPSLSAVCPDAPAPLVAVVDRALEFEKGARWGSASAMRDAVRDAFAAIESRIVSRELLLPMLASRESSDALRREAALAPTPPPPAPLVGGGGQRVSSPSAPPAPGAGLQVQTAPNPVAAHVPYAHDGAAGSGVVRPGPITGGTTAQPVASSPGPSSVRPGPRSGRSPVYAVGAAVLVTLGVVLVGGNYFLGERLRSAGSAPGGLVASTPSVTALTSTVAPAAVSGPIASSSSAAPALQAPSPLSPADSVGSGGLARTSSPAMPAPSAGKAATTGAGGHDPQGHKPTVAGKPAGLAPAASSARPSSPPASTGSRSSDNPLDIQIK